MHRRDAREAGAGKKNITKDGGTGDWTEGEMEVRCLHGSISFLSFLFLSLTHKHTLASASLSKALHFNIYYV